MVRVEAAEHVKDVTSVLTDLHRQLLQRDWCKLNLKRSAPLPNGRRALRRPPARARSESAPLEGWDLFGKRESSSDKESFKRLGNSSPIAKKWRIAYATPQADFLTRARDILAAPEPG
jgi:hypothetical protein